MTQFSDDSNTANQPHPPLGYRDFLHPRWWPSWLAIGCLWLVAQLPLRLQHAMGRLVGWLAYYLLPGRRRVTQTNIALCFPALDQAARQQLVKRAFCSNGIGIFEAATGWFRAPERLRGITHVHGFHHLEAALKKGKGVLLLGGHYSTLDLGGSLISLFIEADIMQRPHNNALFNRVMTRSRAQRYGLVLGRKDLRGLMRRLRANRIIWYAADQDYGRRNSVFAPFFGVPAATITAPARIVGKSGCQLVPFSHFRHEQGLGYDIIFGPALTDFPSHDEIADAARVNQLVADALQAHPDQYLWLHRRFKTRPHRDDPNPYRPLHKKSRRQRPSAEQRRP